MGPEANRRGYHPSPVSLSKSLFLSHKVGFSRLREPTRDEEGIKRGLESGQHVISYKLATRVTLQTHLLHIQEVKINIRYIISLLF